MKISFIIIFIIALQIAIIKGNPVLGIDFGSEYMKISVIEPGKSF